MAEKGDWVKIHNVVLDPSNRVSSLPADTKKVPLEAWINGFLNEDGEIGEMVEITTLSGRIVSGTLAEVNPRYIHDFGNPVPELLKIGPNLKKQLEEGSV
ncbi:MAG: 2-amino-4-oxopentanoate thiolase subunit OrtA [Thermotogae bacterium]|jgi:hypothetical protein|nr:2-amino-4-oxopentanoate thiolase subunit OrtA [Thermotogota bacterium]MCL5032944.1 2-amino-4-oxopentanoate thiolase subunit OrtA [Thermotogota bacterium]